MTPSCAKCRFGVFGASLLSWREGVCCRYPPVITGEADTDSTNPDARRDRFPGVKTDQWCGEFAEAKP